jgi:hypothetical protein
VGWKPCLCAGAREGAERGRGMGHLWVSCQSCHDQFWDTTFYEPPHDIGHRPDSPWLIAWIGRGGQGGQFGAGLFGVGVA